ncbi:hypothetical protein P9112_011657 [Eukaryota sp. TZLM1-RC]
MEQTPALELVTRAEDMLPQILEEAGSLCASLSHVDPNFNLDIEQHAQRFNSLVHGFYSTMYDAIQEIPQPDAPSATITPYLALDLLSTNVDEKEEESPSMQV